MQETKKDQCEVHLEVINLQNPGIEDIKETGKMLAFVIPKSRVRDQYHKNFCPGETKDNHPN